MPFWAVTTAVSGPRSGPRRGAISGRLWAFRVRITASAPVTTERSSVHGGCATKVSSASRTSTPRSRMAARCAPRATRVTSTPARAMRAPRKAPVAPAPTITILMARFSRRRAAQQVRHPGALDLPGRALRDALDEVEPGGGLEVGQVLAAVAQERGLAGPPAKDHRCLDDLPPRVVGDPEAHRLRHRGMLEQGLVDLVRGDLLTRAFDHLLEPPDQREVARRVEESLVAGPEPAVGEGARVRLGVVVVAVDDARPLDHHLPARAHREELALRVHHPDAHADASPDRAGDARGGR